MLHASDVSHVVYDCTKYFSLYKVCMKGHKYCTCRLLWSSVRPRTALSAVLSINLCAPVLGSAVYFVKIECAVRLYTARTPSPLRGHRFAAFSILLLFTYSLLTPYLHTARARLLSILILLCSILYCRLTSTCVLDASRASLK